MNTRCLTSWGRGCPYWKCPSKSNVHLPLQMTRLDHGVGPGRSRNPARRGGSMLAKSLPATQVNLSNHGFEENPQKVDELVTISTHTVG